MIASLQKQIDFHFSEAYRLRTVQNSHVAISRLPAELLSDVFLYVIETGLRWEDIGFATSTFAFLQVCRRWNEVAIAFPQLWVWWIPGTFKAWHLFKSRSKHAPLFLTWREHLPDSAYTVLMESETPKKICRLDFSGTPTQFEHILNALDSRSLSTTSSIRLRILPPDREHLTRFFSFTFPKLSNLEVENFLPDPTSAIFTTSNLTSLKLDLLRRDGRYYTQSQLLQVLQWNQNLRQLDFKAGGLPLAADSGGSAPVLLPHLVDLRLRGTNEVIDGFLGLVCMSSPLHKISIHFQHHYIQHTAPFVNTTQKFLTAYYGSKEPERRRKVSHLAVLSHAGTISAKDDSTHPTYSFEVKFQDSRDDFFFQKVIPLFPLSHVYDCTVAGLDLSMNSWRGILLRMESLSHLQLRSMNTESVLYALNSNDGGAFKESIPTIVFNHSQFHNQSRSNGYAQVEITVVR